MQLSQILERDLHKAIDVLFPDELGGEFPHRILCRSFHIAHNVADDGR